MFVSRRRYRDLAEAYRQMIRKRNAAAASAAAYKGNWHRVLGRLGEAAAAVDRVRARNEELQRRLDGREDASDEVRRLRARAVELETQLTAALKTPPLAPDAREIARRLARSEDARRHLDEQLRALQLCNEHQAAELLDRATGVAS
ncbi:hypothetical protein [Streptomyces sp. NPDC060194]|uniref:hypothetical protein n=1 Tax=Streptomyces sp. NPDC060194 TaxID=3347069 RepID=UPI00364A68DC